MRRFEVLDHTADIVLNVPETPGAMAGKSRPILKAMPHLPDTSWIISLKFP